jgi:hypothetical protein
MVSCVHAACSIWQWLYPHTAGKCKAFLLFICYCIYLSIFLKQLVRYSNVDDHELIIVIRHTVDEDW